MRKLLALTLVAGLVALGGSTGCSQPKKTEGSKPAAGSPTKVEPPKGGPTGPTGSPKVETKGEIKLDDAKAEVEKKGKAEVTIKVARTEYDGAIDVSFDAADAKGIKVTPDKVTIKKGESEAKVTIEADDESKGGDVKVTAKPEDEKVKPATGKITVSIK
jgi:hypothetical protein